MYNAGHFFEMAVAHAQLTDDPKGLNAAKRFADHVDGLFGPGKRYDVDGHQEVELALVKLYRATGERREALEADVSPVIAVLMGMMTGVAGGMIRDILSGEIPLILRREIYATASLCGAVVFAALSWGFPGA